VLLAESPWRGIASGGGASGRLKAAMRLARCIWRQGLLGDTL